jgi:hypothetical protein
MIGFLFKYPNDSTIFLSNGREISFNNS